MEVLLSYPVGFNGSRVAIKAILRGNTFRAIKHGRHRPGSNYADDFVDRVIRKPELLRVRITGRDNLASDPACAPGRNFEHSTLATGCP